MATHEFQAEIRQLLDILVHNVYSSKDVFLRELLSNATDALEKVRFLTARGETVADPDLALSIDIAVTKEPEPKLVITDTGIGMTADEVRDNLGTIARSGAARFLESVKTRQETDEGSEAKSKTESSTSSSTAEPGKAGGDEAKLIGRFGIGFYSVFMVAKQVTLTTRAADPSAKPVRWTSDGLGAYEMEILEGDQPRGTKIEITLKDNEKRFAEDDLIKSTIKTHSHFIPFPVTLGGEQINHTVALWREPPTRVETEQYNEFYKLLSHDDRAPLAQLHTTTDSTVQFSALLYVPPADMLGFSAPEEEAGVQLYTRRVLIDRAAKGLLPPYLRFIRGVVESEDLPLNLSRETLQENAVISKIRKALTRRMTDRLKEIAAEDPDRYLKIWKAYGPILREAIRDYDQHERLAELLRLPSTRSENDKLIGLADYVSSLRDRQKGIYYLPVTSRAAAMRDPRGEWFRRHNLDLLFLENPIDEIVLQSLGKFKDYEILSAEQILPDDREAFKLETDSTEDGKTEASNQDFVGRLSKILESKVSKVRLTDRLSESPVMLISGEGGPSRSVQRLQKMMGLELPEQLPVMEINPRHPLVKFLAEKPSGPESDGVIAEAAEAFYQAGKLLDADVSDPQAAATAMFALLTTLTGAATAPALSTDTASSGERGASAP